jgi:amidase
MATPRNPRDPGITPGGSSAARGRRSRPGIGMSRTAPISPGSIRYPAYACGVHGLRPTMGRIPAL